MRRFFKLLSILLLSGTLIGVEVFWLLYNTAFEQISHQLTVTVQSQKALMTSNAEFDARESRDVNGGARKATLSQIINAQNKFGLFGETGEFTLAERNGSNIKFIFRQRYSSSVIPDPVPLDAVWAEPMRKALNGHSGITIDLDYRGKQVLASYAYVEALQLGIVAKMDISEIRAPFIHIGMIGIFIALVVYSIGVWVFMKLAAPINKELQASEKLYRDLIEGQSELVCRSKLNGTIIFVNEAYTAYFGKTQNELIGTKFIELIPQEQIKGVLEKISTLSPINRSQVHQHKVTASNGKTRWMQWTNTLLLNDKGQSDEVVSVGRDITEQKLALEKLNKTETHQNNLGRILEESMNEIYVFDAQSLKFEMVNKGALKNLGYSLEEMLELKPTDIKPEFTDPEFRELIQPLLDGKVDKMIYETVHQRKDKSQYNVEVLLSCSEEIDHTIVFAIIMDITEKKIKDKKLSNALEGTIHAISLATEARDPYTAGHQNRVSEIAVSIAKEMGLDKNKVNGIHWGALIHDIGKIAIPAEILSKPTKLTDEEFKLIKTHPKAGYEILKDIDFPWPIAEIAYQHHERFNGTGYPQGLKRGAICLEARIVAVADVVEAISSHRPYRPALGIEVALKEIKEKRGEFYDPDVVYACLKLAKENKLPLNS